MLTRFFKSAAATPDSWQLHVDVEEADRRKRERVVRLNTVTVPKLRVLGYGLVSITVLLHNYFTFGTADWSAWMRLNAALALYCAISWYLLHLFYADLRKYFDLGVVFLALDLWMDGVAIYASGAEKSWLFFLAVFRVVEYLVFEFLFTRLAINYAVALLAVLTASTLLKFFAYRFLFDRPAARSGAVEGSKS